MKMSESNYCKQELLDAIDLFLKGDLEPLRIIRLFSEAYVVRMITVENNVSEDEELYDLVSEFNILNQSGKFTQNEMRALRIIWEASVMELLKNIGIAYSENTGSAFSHLQESGVDTVLSFMHLQYFYRTIRWPIKFVCTTSQLYLNYKEFFAKFDLSRLLTEDQFLLVFKTASRCHPIDAKLRISARASKVWKMLEQADVDREEGIGLYIICKQYLSGKDQKVKSATEYIDKCTKYEVRGIHQLYKLKREEANAICFELAALKPVEFFNMAVLNDGNDRLKVELNFVLHYIRAYRGQKVCIINPSPDLMMKLCSVKDSNYVFSFSNPHHAEILRLDKNLHPYIYDLADMPYIDVAFYFPLFVSKKSYKHKLDAITHELFNDFLTFLGHDKTPNRVYALLDDGTLSALLDGDDKKVCLFGVDTIHILPTKFDNSLPSKKCFVRLSRGEQSHKVTLKRYGSIVLDNRKMIVSTDDHFRRTAFQELRNSQDIRRREWKRTASEEGGQRRSIANEYRYCKELSIFYTIERDGRIKAYLCDLPDDRQKKNVLSRGRRIKETITTARNVLPEDIPFWLESKFMNKESVISAVEKMYPSNHRQTLSLKLYFYLYKKDVLQNIPEGKYDLVNSALAGTLGTLTLEEITKQNMDLFLEDVPVAEREAVTVTLDALFTTAAYYRHIPQNILEAAGFRFKQRERNRLREIGSLRKKAFTEAEEKAIVKILFGMVEENPIAIAVLLRLFTGISSRVVLALKWEDISFSNAWGFGVVRISRELSTDGTKVVDLQRKVQYRKIPIHPCIYEILQSYKTAMQSTLPADKKLPSYVFASADEIFPKVAHITSLTKKVVKMANIREETILLPGTESEGIEKSLSLHPGDIFASNFDVRLIEGNYTDGEACYLRGTTPSETIYANYIQMGTMANLNILYDKLRPWFSRYFIDETKPGIITRHERTFTGAGIVRIKNCGGKKLSICCNGNAKIYIEPRKKEGEKL